MSNRAVMHGARGAAAGAEQPRKESMLCSGLALKAQDTLSSTEGAQLPSASFHEVSQLPRTRQSYVTTATEAASHQEVNSAGHWQAGHQHQHFGIQHEASTVAGSVNCHHASSSHVLSRRGSLLQGLGSSGWLRRGGK